jgi:hypothetical protein
MDLPLIAPPDDRETMLFFQKIQMLGLFLQIGNQVLDCIFLDKGLHLSATTLALMLNSRLTTLTRYS